MMLQIIFDHLFRHLFNRNAEESPCPKMPSPISLLDLWKLFKQFARRTTFDSPHNLTASYIWWSRNQNMHTVIAHNPLQNPNFKSFACLSHQFTNSKPNITNLDLVTILCYPNKIILNVIYRVTTIPIFHNCLRLVRDSYSLLYIGISVLKADRLKAVVST